MLCIYNTLTRSKEIFQAVQSGHVSMYVCGITVYDFCHLGHARLLVSFDVIQRWLKASGLKVNYVRNITDIDDKIIQKMMETQQSLEKITQFYTKAMHADECALGNQVPNVEPCATQYIGDIISMINTLKSRGLAYQVSNGDVYYSVRGFSNYGKLSSRLVNALRPGGRVIEGLMKYDPLDFVLWKSAKPEEPSESKWESPYGLGRPGWHIECSAMSKALLGLPLDIHGGGADLKCLHHENEIAQTEGAYGSTLARTWMHCGSMMVSTNKMSKSLKNFCTIRETISTDDIKKEQAQYTANPREAEMLRFFIVRTHYRSSQNYTRGSLIDAQNALDHLYQTLHSTEPRVQDINWNDTYPCAFREAMDDDFNTPKAVSILFQVASLVNRYGSPYLSGQLKALGAILGILQQASDFYFKTFTRYRTENVEAFLSEKTIQDLIQTRQIAKESGNYEQADHIRAQLRASGIELHDKPNHYTQWRRA